jgi:hypothetical protein
MLIGKSIDIGDAVIGDAHILLLGEKEDEVELKVRFGLDVGEAMIPRRTEVMEGRRRCISMSCERDHQVRVSRRKDK